jgi:hypothetical protein
MKDYSDRFLVFCPVLAEQIGYFLVAIMRRCVQSGYAVIILYIHVGTLGNEKLNCVLVTTRSRTM